MEVATSTTVVVGTGSFWTFKSASFVFEVYTGKEQIGQTYRTVDHWRCSHQSTSTTVDRAVRRLGGQIHCGCTRVGTGHTRGGCSGARGLDRSAGTTLARWYPSHPLLGGDHSTHVPNASTAEAARARLKSILAEELVEGFFFFKIEDSGIGLEVLNDWSFTTRGFPTEDTAVSTYIPTSPTTSDIIKAPLSKTQTCQKIHPSSMTYDLGLPVPCGLATQQRKPHSSSLHAPQSKDESGKAQ